MEKKEFGTSLKWIMSSLSTSIRGPPRVGAVRILMQTAQEGAMRPDEEADATGRKRGCDRTPCSTLPRPFAKTLKTFCQNL